MSPDRKEKFWQEVEELHGTVLGYGMGQHYCMQQNDFSTPRMLQKKERTWGLTYVTEKGVFLYRFAKQSLLSAMFKNATQEELRIEVFFSTVLAWRAPKIESFLKRLFGKTDERLLLVSDASATSGEQTPDASTASGEQTQEDSFKYQINVFILDFQQKVLVDLIEHYMSKKKNTELLK